MFEGQSKNKKQKNKKIKKQEHAKHTVSAPNNQKISQQDKRFAKAVYDPKFMTPGSKVTKVAVDKRFSKMLKDKSFGNTSKIDRYGRKVDGEGINNELKEYYYLENEDQQDKNSQMDEEMHEEMDEEMEEEHEDIRDWMQNYNEESSELEDIDLEDLQGDIEEVWDESQEHVIKGQNVKATKRLALCNYDWMNINSKDLMILFNSFKPKSGFIRSVKVYMSNIGKQKLQEEQKHGPTGIWKQDDQEVEEKAKPDWKKSWKDLLKEKQQNQNEAFDESKLRQYEKERLKYFYAVIECDSKQTADEIYKECDGNQFQNSTIQFDLRFIPGDTVFDPNNLKDECSEIPQNGEVKNFVNRALGHSKVNLSWEDPELSLSASLKKKNWNKLSEAQLQKIDWGTYIDEHQIEEEDQMVKLANQTAKEEDVVTDWKKSCNKKYKKGNDDIEITFQGGFDTKNKKQAKDEREIPSLNKQKKTMKERKKLRLEKKEEEDKKRDLLSLVVDEKKQVDFNPDLEDERFKAVGKNPEFAIDPTDPNFDHRRSGKVFAELVKKNKNKHRE